VTCSLRVAFVSAQFLVRIIFLALQGTQLDHTNVGIFVSALPSSFSSSSLPPPPPLLLLLWRTTDRISAPSFGHVRRTYGLHAAVVFLPRQILATTLPAHCCFSQPAGAVTNR